MLTIIGLFVVGWAGYFLGHSMGQSKAAAFWKGQFEQHLQARSDKRKQTLFG